MELLRKNKLGKLKTKNRGNTILIRAIDRLISDIENATWTKQTDIKETRFDADCVHSDGFYFFDINIHRTMILIVFEDNEATVIWTGSHDEYDKTFKGNKTTIEKWLRVQKLIKMDKFSIQNIQKINVLTSELEYEKATSLYLKLRVLVKEDKSYEPIRKHLRGLIKDYEQIKWADEGNITDHQIKESDLAEAIVHAENEFYQKRKELIKAKLKDAGLTQNDLAKILEHRKGYMSELINGLRPFSKEDLIVINRLFKIKFEDLIPAFIQHEKASHIKKTLESLSHNKIRLTKKDFDLRMA